MAGTYFTDVKLLLHANGTNNATTFTDSGVVPKAVAAVGNAKISTTQSKFGGASAYFDGAGDYLTLPNSTDWDFGDGDFTIEAWIYTTQTTGKQVIFGGGAGTLSLYINGSDLWFGPWVSNPLALTSSSPIVANTWQHIAVTRVGYYIYLFVDGIQVEKRANYYSVSSLTPAPPRVGSSSYSSDFSYFQGYIDELRVTKGVGRYSANFSVPTAAFPNTDELYTAVFSSAPSMLGATADALGNVGSPPVVEPPAPGTAGLLYGLGANWSSEIQPSETEWFDTPTLTSNTVWKSIALGSRSVIGVKADGTLWAWGDNYGALGLGADTSSKTVPTQIGVATDWSKAYAADGMSMAIKADGTLWVWGDSYDGYYLGVGEAADVSVPFLRESTWLHAVQANWGGLGIRTDGTLWGWGDSGYGELGVGDDLTHVFPVQVGSDTWVAVDTLYGYSAGIKTDGTLWAWGRAYDGAIGDGVDHAENVLAPIQVGLGYTWAAVAVGPGHKLAIRADGTLWSWGNGGYGELGTGVTGIQLAPVQVGVATDWAFLEAGWYASYAIKTDGSLWGWGNNNQGVFDGTHVYSDVLTPLKVSDGPFASVSRGVWDNYNAVMLTGVALGPGELDVPNIASGFFVGTFGAPSGIEVFNTLWGEVTAFGAPTVRRVQHAGSLGSITKYAPANYPFARTLIASGSLSNAFGNPTAIRVSVANIVQIGQAFGFIGSFLGSPRATWMQTGIASGYAGTQLGKPAAVSIHRALNFFGTQLGIPLTHSRMHAKGFIAAALGAPILRIVQPGTGINAPTRFGRPAGLPKIKRTASGFYTSSLGTPSCREVHRGMHIPPGTCFGKALLRRSTQC